MTVERFAEAEAPPPEVPRRPRRRDSSRRARKAALAIAQELVDDITDSSLDSGTKMPGERDMLVRFGAGRGTLRESLRFLEMNGVITVKAGPHGGPIVSDPDGQDLARVLGLYLQMRGLPFKALVTAREVLEPELAALAATAAEPAHVAVLADSIDGMRAFLDDEQNFLAENDRFHQTVAAASGNDLFALLISSLHAITDGMPLGVSYPVDRRRAVIVAHQAVQDAIAQRDPEGARWAMRRHMREFRKYVERNFPGVYDRTVRWRDVAP